MNPDLRPDRDTMRRFYGALLRMYPAWFQVRYGRDLLQAFDDRRAEPRFGGTLGGLRLILFLVRDFVTSLPLAREPERDHSRWKNLMSDMVRDLRYSVRMLFKSPVFTLAAVLTLALGIGMNAATFSAVHGLLLRPLPGAEEPDELVQLYRHWPGIEYGSNSIPHYQDVRDRTGEVFEGVAAWYFASMSMAVDGRSERHIGMLVSANFFQTYGAEPVLGRAFLSGEESVGPNAHPVAVLDHGFWQARFGGDPGIVGRTLILNGQPFQVVGVASRDFQGPLTVAAPPIYVPLMMQQVIDPGRDRINARGNNMMNVVARLRDGVSFQRAQEAMSALLLQLKEEMPESYEGQLGSTMVLQSEAGIHPTFRNAQVGLSAVMSAVVGLLLLIACVNVANLFLARARERRQEMGIRLSLGAGSRRIIQQLMTESFVFSLVAGVAGLALARVAIRFLRVFRPPLDGPWRFAVEMNNTVLLFTLGVSVLAGFLFGLAPALQSARSDTMSAVKGQSSQKPGRSRMSSGLVVLQMALSLILLISSGLFLRSLQGATEIDPGFDEPASLVMASLDPGLQGYDEERSREILERIVQEVTALPEVSAAGLTMAPPLGLSSSDQGVGIPGYEFSETERRSISYSVVSPGYLETLGVDLLEGRTFTPRDDGAGAPVIIVNRRFTERFWPGESPLGKVVQTASEDREVIGVVETGKYGSLGEEPLAFMYLPHREIFQAGMSLVARTPTDPRGALRRIREVVRAVDPNMPLFDVRTMEDHMGIALLPARLGGSVLGIFGLLGLTLAAVGIYGVMAYSVAQRKRELGIRVALGADGGRVVRLVLGEGLRLAILGVVLGLVGALAGARLIAGLLYNVSPVDPVAFVGVPALLVSVAVLAVYLPARRASRSDPMGALKTE